ncbi:MAG: signal peptidase I [Ectothiorhodospiraceae bacterium]|nr:signal peptidase I [Ectothiorhodospiraceae bacterium]
MRFDFPTVMVLLVVVTGVIWAFDAAVLARRRRESAAAALAAGSGEVPAPSRLVEYARSFFPVFLIVLVLRSFLVEPFRIPSGSMMPTLLIGDFILVNKFEYGIRLPILDFKLIELGAPERGDVVVFRSPEDPSVPFIKRVVGLPGDEIAYYRKTLYVNGAAVEQRPVGEYTASGSASGMNGATLLREVLGAHPHDILVQPGMPSAEGKMVVPEGNYFVMGDNRDNSRDSRYWGTVPDELLIGRAFRIWMHWTWEHGIEWARIGDRID